MQFLELLRSAQSSYRASYSLRLAYHLACDGAGADAQCARQTKRAAIEV